MTDERYVCRIMNKGDRGAVARDEIFYNHKDAAYYGAWLWQALGLRSQIIKASDVEGWGGK